MNEVTLRALNNRNHVISLYIYIYIYVYVVCVVTYFAYCCYLCVYIYIYIGHASLHNNVVTYINMNKYVSSHMSHVNM
jgi:hypothetical protein